MDMKKKILLSMILLALCLIQASADTYYFKIRLYKDDNHSTLDTWSGYITVSYDEQQKDWVNGLRDLYEGNIVKDDSRSFQLPKKGNEVDLDRIYGIVFANGKGLGKNEQETIMEGGEYNAWVKIREHIKYLELRKYKCATYNNSGYCMNMHNVEELELPEEGMEVGSDDEYGKLYFANADKLKDIYIWINNEKVKITDDKANNRTLLNRVGREMFSNCYSLSTNYINRLIRDVTEIKYRAFYAGDEHRGHFSDDTDNKMAIEIPTSATKVTKIGSQAFYNRVKVTGLNIQGDGGSLEIGSEAFRGCDELHDLNLKNAKITYLGTGVFGECRSMTKEFVNNVLTNYATNGGTKIPAYLFYGCNGQGGYANKCTFTKLNIPEQFSEIGDGAFASTDDAEIKLKTITVNRVTAPTCQCVGTDKYVDVSQKDVSHKTVFDGLEPNLTTVIFENAATGWKETETETTGFLTYMNDGSEFQRLLTKDIYSDHTEYINVPQQHAIVRLHRTLKVGWNTICLPFGVNNRYGKMWYENGYNTKQACNARIIVNGLTHTNTNNNSVVNHDNFTMGVYRGYWEQGKTFMFLHYTKFNDYPLDFCETFLVKMRPEDIAKAEKEKDDKGVHTYTFTNVDLNYRWTASDGNNGTWTYQTYTAEQMPQQVKPFYGNENTTEIPFQGKASHNKYVLKGSLVQRTGTVGDGTISTNDYFFQQTKDGKMKLYPYKAGQKYGIRGFSGWFQYNPKPNTSPSKASELSLSLFDDGSTTPIETVKVDDLNRDTSGKVYSISGVLVKNNAADLNSLSKGIYVVNGKKYVVK